jgi:hypothetical protein
MKRIPEHNTFVTRNCNNNICLWIKMEMFLKEEYDSISQETTEGLIGGSERWPNAITLHQT